MQFNFLALQNLYLKLYLFYETVAEHAPSFPASLCFLDQDNSCGWNATLVDTSSLHAEGARRLFCLFEYPTHICPGCLLLQSDNFSISCLLPAVQSWASRRKIHVKSGLFAAWALAKRSTGRWGTMFCSALLLLGKAWVRLMKLDLTPTAVSPCPSLSFYLINHLFFVLTVWLDFFLLLHFGVPFFPCHSPSPTGKYGLISWSVQVCLPRNISGRAAMLVQSALTHSTSNMAAWSLAEWLQTVVTHLASFAEACTMY